MCNLIAIFIFYNSYIFEFSQSGFIIFGLNILGKNFLKIILQVLSPSMQASPALWSPLLIASTATAPRSHPTPSNADHVVRAATTRSLCILYNRGVLGAVNAAFQQRFPALSPARIRGVTGGCDMRPSKCWQPPLFYEQMSPR